jgi:hypothetical protein
MPAESGFPSQHILSSTLAFLQSLASASPSRPHRLRSTTGSSHGLLLPSTHAGNGGPLSTGHARPAMFRLQGLATLLTVYSPRNLAGLVSSRQRSWDSPLRSVLLRQGGRRVSTVAGPACRQYAAISCG